MSPYRALFAAASTLILLAAVAGGCPSATPEARDADSAGPTPRPPANGEVTLLLMADIRGVLRPCGCTVDLQKGGFDRLAPFLAKERAHYPDAKLLHAGPIFFEDAQVDPAKRAQLDRQAQVAADLVARIGIDVAGATAADAAAAAGQFKELAERAHLTLTAANLNVPGGPPTSRSRFGRSPGSGSGSSRWRRPTRARSSGRRGRSRSRWRRRRGPWRRWRSGRTWWCC